MHERIKNELALEAGCSALGSLVEVVEAEDRQLLFTVVTQAVKHAIEIYEVRMAWMEKRGIATEVSP